MKLIEEVKGFRKENVYEYYFKISDNPKDYDKITKTKIIQEVFKIYSDYNNIIDICTQKELKYLENALNGAYKEGNYNDYKDETTWVIRTLEQKFLIFRSFKNGLAIPEEIIENVKLAVKNVDYKKKKQEDEINIILVSYFKQLGGSILFPACQFMSGISQISEESIWKHMLSNRLFNYYVTIVEKNFDGIKGAVPYGIHNDYINYIDEINDKRKKNGLAGSKQIDLRIFKTLFYYDFDINNPTIVKFLDELYKLPIFTPNVVDAIKEYSALNSERDSLKKHIQSIPIIKYKDLTAFFKSMDKAMDEMPSCALNGFTPNEAKNIKMLEMKNEIKKAQQYIPQTDACLDKKDAKLFYKLYFALIDFTNEKYKINHHVKFYNRINNNPNDMTNIIEMLWNNKEEVFNEFINANPYKFNDDELKIVNQMKNGIRDIFVIAKFESEYTGFIYKDKVYMVKGINDNLDNVVSYDLLPYPVITTIIPFKNVLIYDSILQGIPTKLDPMFTSNILEEYKKLMKYYHL